MKFLLLTAFVFIYVTASGQAYKNPPQTTTIEIDLLNNLNINNNYFNKNMDSLFNRFKNYKPHYNLLPGTIYLRQDNMPCIIPPTFGLGLIPNATNKNDAETIGLIPNAAIAKTYSIPLIIK